MTTITLPRRMSLPGFRPPTVRAVLLAFAATLALGLALLVALSVAIGVANRGVVMPRVSVAGVDVSGMNRAQVADRLAGRLPSLADGEVTITADGREAVIGFAEIGRGYELEEMTDAAFGIGRGSDALSAGLSRLRSLFVGTTLPVEVHAFDASALDEVASGLATRFSFPAVDAHVAREGTTYVVTDSTDGSAVDASAIGGALSSVAATADPGDVRIDLVPRRVAPAVSSEDAREAARAATRMARSLALSIPGADAQEDGVAIDAATIAGWISFGPDYGVPYAALVDETAVATAVDAMRTAIDREAVDASFSLAGGGLGGVIPGLDGRALDVDATATSLLDGLASRASGARLATLPLVVEVTQPQLTTAEAEAAFPQMQFVSGWTTYYPPHNGNAYNPNIVIPALTIDGTVLAPGETLSFWNAIGPVTVERGYTYGGAIINGRSVPNGALAGGICSTSTTLFNAALRYGLAMGDRGPHFYYIERYPTGLDASVYMDGSVVQDMTFTNDTAYPVVVRGMGGGGWVRFEIWTVPDGRSVAFSNTVTSAHRSAIETTQVSNALAPGAAQRVEYPHDGFNASVTRWVYAADGSLLHENHYFSEYHTVNGITVVGPTAEAPPSSEEEEPPPEAPPGDGGVTPP